eukprot:gene19401-16639_t
MALRALRRRAAAAPAMPVLSFDDASGCPGYKRGVVLELDQRPDSAPSALGAAGVVAEHHN